MIDGEIQRFIDETNDFYPADAVNFSIPEQRRWYNKLCEAFSQPRPDEVTAEDHILSLPGRQIGLRHYHHKDGREDAVILFLHGGGFILGGLESHDDSCNEICATTGLDIVAVDYRLCPEYRHPAAYEDALAAFDHLILKGRPVILVGDSAGGTLCASLARARSAHSGGNLLGQVLIYPSLGADLDTPSMKAQTDAPGLTREDIKYYMKMRAGDDIPEADPSFLPMAANTFAGLPPSALFAAEIDPLCDDCAIYAGKLRSEGIPVHDQVDLGLIHGHLRARRMSEKAAKSFSDICRAITLLADRQPITKMSE